MTQFIPDKVEIDAIIINIISEIPLNKVHPKIIASYQYISNITGINSGKSTPEILCLYLPLKSHHTFETKENGFQSFFGNKKIMHKGREVWFHIYLIAVLKNQLCGILQDGQ